MAMLNKLSTTVATGAAALLALGAAPAQAALFKYSFEGDGANGYFIYDNSTEAGPTNPLGSAYVGAVKEYYINTAKGIFQGETTSVVVYLTTDSNSIELEARGNERQPESEFELLGFFDYPVNTFGGSTAIPTTVPSTATATIYPNVIFPETLGEPAFFGTVQTRIVPVPEPASLLAVFGVGAWLLIRRRQCQQALH